MKSKPFIVANVRDILDQYDREEISFSRMTEMFNEVAFKWADEARRDAAIGFAEWVRTRFYSGNDGTWHEDTAPDISRSYTTSEIYNLYLKKQIEMTEELINTDMTVEEFYSGFNLDFMTPEEVQTIYTATELFAKGKVKKEIAEKDRVIAKLNLALNEAEKKIKQLDTKPY